MISFLQGDVFDKLKDLDDNSIDCVVTSPPYWGLRDYGVDGQLGLEPTYQEHIKNIVELFRAMKPKLKDTATVWLNYGDSYAATVNGTKVKDMKKNLQKNRINKIKGKFDDRGFVDKPFSTIQGSLKPKDLVMIPNRIAIALQDDGWWIRSEIIWHKPNPMPESTKDRPTSCHEKIWLITKSKKYYYDADAIKEVCKTPNKEIRTPSGWDTSTGKNGHGKIHKQGRSSNFTKSTQQPKKNKRNVWTVTTKPCKDAHFATFPKDLAEPCIKAGCPEKVCVECGIPYISNYKRTDNNENFIQTKGSDTPNIKKGGVRLNKNGTSPHFNPPTIEFLNLKKNCNCKTDEFKSGVVLDPFGGSGTTGIVAKQFNRTAILIELNPEYIEIAKKRIDRELGMFK